jgi:hypothetical protein
MAGSVYFIVIVAIGAILAAVTGTIFLLIPFVLIGLAVVLLPLAFAAARGTHLEPGVDEPHGVPTTREASYEPVDNPAER